MTTNQDFKLAEEWLRRNGHAEQKIPGQKGAKLLHKYDVSKQSAVACPYPVERDASRAGGERNPPSHSIREAIATSSATVKQLASHEGDATQPERTTNVKNPVLLSGPASEDLGLGLRVWPKHQTLKRR